MHRMGAANTTPIICGSSPLALSQTERQLNAGR
jgi:hypothetical protein